MDNASHQAASQTVDLPRSVRPSRVHQSPRARFSILLATFWGDLGSWRYGLLYLVFMLPFATYRQIRIHGDEKVYVGQALEMFRAGHFWQQLQFGDVNYIKGPLHYLILIGGQALFGLHMLSTVYMNLLLGALALVALRSASRHLFPDAKAMQFLPAIVFASCGSYVFFTFSSQMESELTSLYAIALALSVLAQFEKKSLNHLLLWITVGAAGALKSPLHSILLGLSVVLYFFTHPGGWRDLVLPRVRLAFLLLGVIICGAGYLVPYLLDSGAWVSGYIMQEQVNRPQFADSVVEFFLNNFVLHLIPWCLVAIPALKAVILAIRTKRFDLTEQTRAALCFIAPTLMFFSIGGYVAPWYGLPMLSGIVLLLVGMILNQHTLASSNPVDTETLESKVSKTLCRCLLPWIGIAILLIMVTHIHFGSDTPWWTWHSTSLCLTLLVAAFWILDRHLEQPKYSARTAIVTGICLLWGAALILSTRFGEAELLDARTAQAQHNASITFSNVTANNYNEWCYMAHMLEVETHYAMSNKELLKASRNGNWLVFQSIDELEAYWAWLSEHGLKGEFLGCAQTRIWRRWPRNAPQFFEIWRSKPDYESTWNRATREMILFNSASC